MKCPNFNVSDNELKLLINQAEWIKLYAENILESRNSDNPELNLARIALLEQIKPNFED